MDQWAGVGTKNIWNELVNLKLLVFFIVSCPQLDVPSAKLCQLGPTKFLIDFDLATLHDNRLGS